MNLSEFFLVSTYNLEEAMCTKFQWNLYIGFDFEETIVKFDKKLFQGSETQTWLNKKNFF